LTSLSYSLNGLDLDDEEASSGGRAYLGADTESLPIADKEALLAQAFPSVKPFDISYTLRKCKNEFDKAVDELLNQAFLLEEPNSDGERHAVPKGIEGFISTSTSRRPKGKRRKQAPSSSTSVLSDKSPNCPNGASSGKWDQAASDISYLTERTHHNHTSTFITSLYNTHNRSLPATILALCSSYLPNPNLDIDSTSDLLASQAIDLAHDFPSLPSKYLTPLLILTYPSLSSAHDLAKILANYDPSSSSSAIKITPQYARPIPPPPSPPLKAKISKPPLGPLTAPAADHLVSATTTPTSLDLHGIDVRNAKRIALQHVEAWWSSGVSEYAREGKAQGWAATGGVKGRADEQGGFVIVVGQGLHSEGGRAKVGPAVVSMLMKEGWRVQVGVGSLVVRGRVRVTK
jgi:hypothetical protein